MLIKLNDAQLSDVNAGFNWQVEQYDDVGRVSGAGGTWQSKGVNNRVVELNARVPLLNIAF